MIEVRQTGTFRDWFERLREQRGAILVILLHGGDKSSQRRDIRQAKALASELED